MSTNRAPKKQRTCRISVTTTPQVKAALENLVSLGMFGTSVSDAAERLICQGLQADLRRKRQQLFDPPKPTCSPS